MTLAHFKLFNKLNVKNEPKFFYLNYDTVSKRINLFNANDLKESISFISKNKQIEDDFWNTLEITFSIDGSIELKINEMFNVRVQKLIEVIIK
jgi:hypothetical protein